MESLNPHVVVRAETKIGEHRVALVPADARVLVDAGFRVSVEACPQRIFSASEYARAGCAIVPAGFWRKAPLDVFVLGLKELPDDPPSLSHRHIFFGHAFEQQRGARRLLDRFARGGGLLLDLESLTVSSGKRAAAFGHWAGYLGAALGIAAWYRRQGSPPTALAALTPFVNSAALVEWVESARATAPLGSRPRILILGALGRSGCGARALLTQLGLAVSGWDKKETRSGGPFAEILEFDLLIHCALASQVRQPFLTPPLLHGARRLSVIVDVSGDPQSPHNPLPIYREATTCENPVRKIRLMPDLDVIAIDHLATLLPRESSLDFSSQLLPHLLGLAEGTEIWCRAEKVFWRHRDPERHQIRGGTVA